MSAELVGVLKSDRNEAAEAESAVKETQFPRLLTMYSPWCSTTKLQAMELHGWRSWRVYVS